MDFFDDVLGRIIPILIVFVIFRNLLTVIFGGRKPQQESEEEPTEYDAEGNPIDWEQEEEEEPEEAAPESPKTEEQLILEEFERMLRKPKEPPVYVPETAPQGPLPKKEQKVLHDEDIMVIHRDDEPHHDSKGVILRDAGDFEKDNSKIYREKPLIEQDEIKHVQVAQEVKKPRVKAKHPKLLNAVKWAEILGKPKSM